MNSIQIFNSNEFVEIKEIEPRNQETQKIRKE